MVSGHPPFVTAQSTDPFYRCLAANRSDIFWKTHEKSDGLGYYSPEFKDLVQSMLQLDPAHRPSMAEVMCHPWFAGETMTKEQVHEQFYLR
jgi:serine/threonine protein kinase